MSKNIFFVVQNVHGAWVIYGANNVKQYYGYTKQEAINKYNEECGKVIFTNMKKG